MVFYILTQNKVSSSQTSLKVMRNIKVWFNNLFLFSVLILDAIKEAIVMETKRCNISL